MEMYQLTHVVDIFIQKQHKDIQMTISRTFPTETQTLNLLIISLYKTVLVTPLFKFSLVHSKIQNT